MPQDPYAPPASRVDDPPLPPLPPRPKQVTTGVALLWASFFLGIPSFWLSAARDPETALHPASIAITLVIVVFSIVLNVNIYRGRNWARIVSLIFVLIAFGLVLGLPPEPVPASALENTLTVISLVLDVVAMFFLFTMPAVLWFRAGRV